jgi:hypothetical protein
MVCFSRLVGFIDIISLRNLIFDCIPIVLRYQCAVPCSPHPRQLTGMAQRRLDEGTEKSARKGLLTSMLKAASSGSFTESWKR